ncbi:hypothetical protein W03_05670 [Nitrosomonas sp. PY1]|uniref:Lcl C-terminal domain-containing protein n=1 Tax=Nitrosomonas sp. PY1 TaxID=1803906 RepID=UPI001FC80104|nr:DUF1566 domain-containing protein [Nitrosomonas sp. PY1]GKS68563.1 hypothetical protein W03_05670 [Nitrosomonas sp. PY1]
MKQNIDKQPAAILTILLFITALMLSGSVFADKLTTKTELDAATATDANTSTITAPVRHIGDRLSDGSIVFWVDETGKHGLAAQPFDDNRQANWYAAEEHAENHGSGWRLPTKPELNLLFQQRDVVGGFADHLYWSSTEHDATLVWYQHFHSGVQYYGNKGKTLSVRAVRAF